LSNIQILGGKMEPIFAFDNLSPTGCKVHENVQGRALVAKALFLREKLLPGKK